MKLLVAGALVLVAVTAPVVSGAAGYDGTNPVSTGCSTRGLVNETRTIHTFGPWNVRLRRSTGCNTAWAVVTRTDGKKCNPPANCAKIKLTRVRADGFVSTTSRRQVDGTTSQYSMQLNAVVGARYTARASTFGGTLIGDSATLRYNADGTWTLV